MAQAPLTVRRWTREEYDRLVNLGVFADEPLELIGGQLMVAEPKGEYHTSGVSVVEYAVRAVLPAGWIVRTQAPLSLDDESSPEPDVVVVPGRPGDYRYAHPTGPPLAIEISDSSLAFDRLQKGSLYARAGLADYWIVNLVDRSVEVHRDPIADAAAAFGWRYRSVVVLRPGGVLVSLAFPDARIAVTDLLP
jgi:Uma2 family endonuclease